MRREVDPLYFSVGQLVRERRKAKGLTGTQLGFILGVGPADVCNIELGRSRPSLGKIVAMGNVLGFTLADIKVVDSSAYAERVLRRRTLRAIDKQRRGVA